MWQSACVSEGPKCPSPSALWVSKSPNVSPSSFKIRVLSDCILRDPLSDEMWLEQNSNHKGYFMYMTKDKYGRVDFAVLNFEAESECTFQKLFKLAMQIWFS